MGERPDTLKIKNEGRSFGEKLRPLKILLWPHEMCVPGFEAVYEDILTGAEAVGDGHEIGPVSCFLYGHPTF